MMKGYFKILSAVCMTILGLSPSPDKSNSFKVLIDIIHQNLKPFGISDFFVSAALRFGFRHCGVLHVRLIPESSRAFHLPQTRKSLNLGLIQIMRQFWNPPLRHDKWQFSSVMPVNLSPLWQKQRYCPALLNTGDIVPSHLEKRANPITPFGKGKDPIPPFGKGKKPYSPLWKRGVRGDFML